MGYLRGRSHERRLRPSARHGDELVRGGVMPRTSSSRRGTVVGMEERTPRGDPILALLPAERPWAFDLLPFEEQQWRARVFLAVWINTGSAIFAWAQALR